MSMSDPRELEWAKKPDALKEGWKTRVGTHMVHGVPLTAITSGRIFGLFLSCHFTRASMASSDSSIVGRRNHGVCCFLCTNLLGRIYDMNSTVSDILDSCGSLYSSCSVLLPWLL